MKEPASAPYVRAYLFMSAHTLCVLPTSFTQLEKHLCARNCSLFRAIAHVALWGPYEQQLLLSAWITCHTSYMRFCSHKAPTPSELKFDDIC